MVTLNQYTIRDTFTDDDGTTLANHASDVNFSGNAWKKQFTSGGTLEIQSNQVKLPALVFGLPYTLYTKDAGSENYITRIRMAGTRVQPVYFWFRVAPNNTAYGIQANHDGANSYLRFVYFNGTSLVQLSEVNPGSLTDGGFYWYQIHVVGSSARVFVEGLGVETKTTMLNNLSETLIGLGGQRATQLVDELQVIPLSPGAAGTDLSTRMLLLEESVDSILTSVPAAITSLKDDIGVATVEAIDADPPAVDLVANAISNINNTVDTALSDYDAPTKAELDSAITTVTNAFSSITSSTAVAIVSSDQPKSNTNINVFQGEATTQSIIVYQSDGTTPYDLSGKILEVLFETDSQELIYKIESDDITVTGDDSNIVGFTIPSSVTSTRKTKYWSVRDTDSTNRVYINGELSISRAVIDS